MTGRVRNDSNFALKRYAWMQEHADALGERARSTSASGNATVVLADIDAALAIVPDSPRLLCKCRVRLDLSSLARHRKTSNEP